MGIRKKTIFAVFVTVGLLVASLFIFSQMIVKKGFQRVENREAKQNIGRIRDAIALQIETISLKMNDWAAWDDAHIYMQDGNEAFEKSSLPEAAVLSMQLELFVWRLPNGQIRWGKVIDIQKQESKPVPADMIEFFNKHHSQLFEHKNETDKKSGLINVPGLGPMVVAIHPIVTSDVKGPIVGSMLMGRALNSAMMEGLEKLTHLKLNYEVYNEAKSKPLFKEAAAVLKSEKDFFIRPVSENKISGYTLFLDIFNNPLFIFEMNTPRDIHDQGTSTIWSFIFALCVAGVIVAIVIAILLERLVISRITVLNAGISEIQSKGDLSLRVKAEGSDEISELAMATNSMMNSIEESKNSMKLLLDNALQGFLSFDKMGKIGHECSKAVTEIFGTNPSGKHIAHIFNQPEDKWNEFVSMIFSESLDFSDLIGICPKVVEVNNKIIELNYRPIYNEGKLSNVLVMATDVTELRTLSKKAEEDRIHNLSIIKILCARNDFIELVEMSKGLGKGVPKISELKRTLHTLKGGFAFLECRNLVEKCHSWENELQGSVDEKIMKNCIQDIQNEVEKFLSDNKKVLGVTGEEAKTVAVDVNALTNVIDKACKINAPHELIDDLEKLAQKNCSEVFENLSQAFVTTAEKLAKEARPIVWRESLRINPEPYKALFKSLIHVVRNAADHGIEYPDEREALGKPRAGTIYAQLSVTKNGLYQLQFEDDGGGINFDKIRAREKSKGNMNELTDSDCLNLLFESGFSTKSEVSETSGRGVGLDAVRAEAKALGGNAYGVVGENKGLKVIIEFPVVRNHLNVAVVDFKSQKIA